MRPVLTAILPAGYRLCPPLALLLVALLLVQPAAVVAADAAAAVVALRGEAIAINEAGEERTLTVKAPVFEADTIRTASRARLQLMFTDNTIFSLGSETEMRIDRYSLAAGQEALVTRVEEGAFRVMGGAITRTAPERFVTETPAAAIGIRGSMYAGRVRDQALSVVFLGGVGIYVRNEVGMVEISQPGYGTRVASPTSLPTPPAPFSPEELEELDDGLFGPDQQPAGPVPIDPPAVTGAMEEIATGDATTFSQDDLAREVDEHLQEQQEEEEGP